MSDIIWSVTTQNQRWQKGGDLAFASASGSMLERSFEVMLNKPAQPIDGVGGSFSERGWDALSTLAPDARDEALSLLFGDQGAGFTVCRTPLAGNDLARDWYSYDETPGDFALENFSIENDLETLVPYIKAALALRPDLCLWSSPWSPPTWMKKNGHYALAPAWPGAPETDIRPEQYGAEDTDAFRLEEKYLDAYARYFRRYVEAYRAEGIEIGMVMPQNEFNSAQPFPSCTWTPEGLRQFIPYLAREMESIGVDVFLGSLERPRPELIDAILADPQVASVVKGLGIQWAARDALPVIKTHHPDTPIWGTEQECGRGTNDWHYTRYGWDTLRGYFLNGARVWTYWNMVLPSARNVSGWGWPQNMLIAVNDDGSFETTHDYWLMRHLSVAARPGGHYIPTFSLMGFNNQLAFKRPDGSLALVINNQLADPLPIRMGFGRRQLDVLLPADSFSTIEIPANLLAG